jgi:hypothetical protein
MLAAVAGPCQAASQGLASVRQPQHSTVTQGCTPAASVRNRNPHRCVHSHVTHLPTPHALNTPHNPAARILQTTIIPPAHSHSQYILARCNCTLPALTDKQPSCQHSNTCPCTTRLASTGPAGKLTEHQTTSHGSTPCLSCTARAACWICISWTELLLGRTPSHQLVKQLADKLPSCLTNPLPAWLATLRLAGRLPGSPTNWLAAWTYAHCCCCGLRR